MKLQYFLFVLFVVVFSLFPMAIYLQVICFFLMYFKTEFPSIHLWLLSVQVGQPQGAFLRARWEKSWENWEWWQIYCYESVKCMAISDKMDKLSVSVK